MFGAIVCFNVIFLWSFHYSEREYRPPVKTIKMQLDRLSQKERVMIQGLVFGQKPRSKKLKQAIKNLNIYHLFTPSGLHLSSLLWFLALFSLRGIGLCLLFPVVIGVDGFFAFKRVYFIKAICEILRRKSLYPGGYYVFLFVFLIEFVFRAGINPLSFSYSFLFLGTIYSFRRSSPLVLLTGLYFSQALVASFNENTVHLMAFPLNSVLTFLITMSYPLIILNAIIPIGFAHYLHDFVLFLSDFLEQSDFRVAPAPVVILLGMALMKRIRRVGVMATGIYSTLSH